MIKQIDRQTAAQIRAELDAALPAVGEKLGIKFVIGRGTFNNENITFKLQAAVIAPSGEAVTAEATAFKQMAMLYGLKPEDLGKSFMSSGYSFTITGLKPRASQFPILAKRADGKVFKFPADTIKQFLYPTPQPPTNLIQRTTV